MSPYEFVFRLHDLFTSPLTRIANNYNRVTAGMQRRSEYVSRMFAPMGNAMRRSFTAPQGSVAELMKQLDALKQKAQNIDIRVNRRGLIEANRDIQWMEKRIEKLQGLGVSKGRGGGMGGGGMPWLMAGGMAAGLAYGVYNTAEAAAGMTIKPAMQREVDKMMISNFLKDKKAGNALSGDIAKFAAANPVLGAEESFSSGRRLLAAGFKKDEIIPELKMLGDLSAGSKTSLDALTYLYKQVKQNGFAQAQELSPLADYIPIYDEISKMIDKPIKDVKKLQEDGKITFQMVQKALQNMVGKGGLYENASGALANTTEGKYSQLQADFQEKMIELGLKALPTVNTALDFISRNAERLAPLQEPMGQLFEALGYGVDVTAKLLKAFGILNKEGDLSKGFIDGVSTAIDTLTLSMKGFHDIVGGLIDFFQRPIFGYDEEQAEEDRRTRQKIRQMKAESIMGKDAGSMALIGLVKQLYPDTKIKVPFDPNYKASPKNDPIKMGGSGLGQSTGLQASVSGAKSSVVNINFKSFIERNEINVETYNEGINNLEGKLMDLLSRLLSSGGQILD